MLTTTNAKPASQPWRRDPKPVRSPPIQRLPEDSPAGGCRLIAIKEPEVHLHPNAVRATWQILRDLPGQKIMAMHSGDILSEVPVGKLRRLSHHNSATECKAIPDGLLTPEEQRKFNHHVRRNCDGLLFARCWLLVEGETDVSVFAEGAGLLEIDLHRHGIRIVEISQAGGPGIFIKVADSLGIKWYLVADGDDGEKKYTDTAKKLHSKGVGPQKVGELAAVEGTLEYWEEIYRNLPRRFSKPAAALESIMLMKEKGASGPPAK